MYDPTYEDIIRVAFTAKFDRGKLGDLVALLSGRDFTTRQNLESIKKKTFVGRLRFNTEILRIF